MSDYAKGRADALNELANRIKKEREKLVKDFEEEMRLTLRRRVLNGRISSFGVVLQIIEALAQQPPTQAEIDEMLAGDLPPEISEQLDEIQRKYNAEPKRECGTCKYFMPYWCSLDPIGDVINPKCRNFDHWQPKGGA